MIALTCAINLTAWLVAGHVVFGIAVGLRFSHHALDLCIGLTVNFVSEHVLTDIAVGPWDFHDSLYLCIKSEQLRNAF